MCTKNTTSEIRHYLDLSQSLGALDGLTIHPTDSTQYDPAVFSNKSPLRRAESERCLVVTPDTGTQPDKHQLPLLVT